MRVPPRVYREAYREEYTHHGRLRGSLLTTVLRGSGEAERSLFNPVLRVLERQKGLF